MTAGGGHAHDHALTATGRHRGRLAAVLAITLSIAAGEIAGGALSGSLVLLADAAHMAADAAGVGPVPARRALRQQARDRAAHVRLRPGGDPGGHGQRAAAARHGHVHPGRGGPAAGRAAAGEYRGDGGLRLIALAGNGASLILLRQAQAESLNARGAFLEVASDAFGALAVLVTAGIIAEPGGPWPTPSPRWRSAC